MDVAIIAFLKPPHRSYVAVYGVLRHELFPQEYASRFEQQSEFSSTIIHNPTISFVQSHIRVVSFFKQTVNGV